MADELETAKNSLDVLNEVFELGSTFDHVSHIINLSGRLASAIPVVSFIGAHWEGLLPGDNHKEIINRFNQLDNKIDQLKNYMKYSENVITWAITEFQYAAAVNRIELGIEYCLEIGKASKEDQRKNYRDRVKELCDKQNCAIALKAILDGITGSGLAERNSILDKFYDKTEGHRPKMSALATRLLQLAYRGMIVVSTHEMIVRGKQGVTEITKNFYKRLNEASKKVQSVLDRCENYEDNMLKDLNRFLDKGGSNTDLYSKISIFMSNKYDWLENFVLVNDDVHGFENHCFGGFYLVYSLHRNGKCGIVFFRTKGRQPPMFVDRYYEAYKINDDVSCRNAKVGYDDIVHVAKLNERGIWWTGVAVIRVGQDLKYGGTFSTKDATITGYYATAIILLK